MKSALGYLTLTKLKNQIKDLFHSPAKLIYVVFMAALLAFSVLGRSGQKLDTPQPLHQLTALLTLFYTFMFLMVLLTGGNSAKTPMFTLSDVTMLFPAPLRPNRVLVYGLVRQLGLSLVMGLVLVFQYGWLQIAFGITWAHMALIILGFALCIFLAAFCSMAIYVRTSGNDKGPTILRACVLGATLLYLLWMAWTCRSALLPLLYGGQDYFAALESCTSFLSTFPGLLFPASGWVASIIGGLLTGDTSLIWGGAALCVALIGALSLLVVTCKNNYYEDVLETAELAQSNVTAQKEGNVQEIIPKNVKVGKTGLGKGWGASALFYKHRIENRRAGVFLLSNMSLIFLAITLFVSFGMSRSMDGDVGAALIATFAMGTYMQIFSEGMGRFNRELIKPFIYLMPDPPLKKLLCCMQETLLADCIEAVVLFVPVGFIVGAGPVDIALCVIARISFALLFTAGNILTERVFGTVSSKMLVLFFYFIVLLVMSLPGIAIGTMLMTVLPEAFGRAGLFLGMAAVNVPISILVFYLCRNLLQYAELNNR